MDKNAARHRRNDTTLALSPRTLRALRRALDRAAELAARGVEAGDALARLAADARLIEADAALAAGAGIKALPGCGGAPDIYLRMRGLLTGGERRITREGLLDALRGEGLTMRELWAVPEALRVAIAECSAAVARAVVRDAGACLAAGRFVRRPMLPPLGKSAAFYEHALHLCAEAGLARPRRMLEAALRRAGDTPEAVVRQAHEARARWRVRLENLSDARRMLNAVDWQKCFESLSEAEAELRRDPAGVYPLMDDASRQAVREQVEQIARASGVGERAVAEQAVAAAREIPGGDAARSISDLADADIDPRRTCCWWLHDDAGRRALLHRMGFPRARAPRLAPDPKGRAVMGSIAAVGLGLAAGLGAWLGHGWLIPLLLPAAWAAADAVVARVFPRFVRPARLLKLDIERLPDAWRALVVTPVQIPDAARAEAVCENLEALGCLEDDPNLAFLLLGDFADASLPEQPGDAAIAEAIRARVDAMNRRAGRVKYHWLLRPRTLHRPDGRFMGRDRKRGALMDLNRLLLGGDSAFTESGEALRRGGFRWVLTLDADTRILPGGVHRLVGAAAHPLNRRYAVFQPRMEVAPSACKNRFSRLFFTPGGLDTYPAAASSLWMDMTGAGVYCGKGLYDVAAFHAALDGALPEGRVLSHDLIEGALAGAAFLGDLALFDGCPATLNGWARRLHRWTRGDWQLLPLMLSPGLRLRAADRFRMLDNLLRSLRAPALMGMLLVSAWTGSGEALLATLLLAFISPILYPSDPQGALRALAELALLPLSAWLSLDAALRALWRLFVSGKRLMDWLPSAEADRGGRGLNRVNRLMAALMLPGLSHPNAIPMALGLFALFWTGADWVRDMADEPVAELLSGSHAQPLRELARDTWRFFSESADPLPPDNVQLDPPAEPARRTSPTNVGLYLLSAVAAARLGFIDGAERDSRIAAALDALDRVEKWRGHLYNWIDIDALQPLHPRYVSSVDSGNLAACALACANAVEDAALVSRLRALAEGMDFTALYDQKRGLFLIGVDADTGAPSASRYDLLASESRLLSYVALMLRQVPLKHWARLGRACAPAGREAALLSWSGTLFEYLMPELLLRAPTGTLLHQSARAAVDVHRSCGRPWGVSESGYYAFDQRMNYQYRAFGLPSLALDGDAAAGVIAPYASALALCVAPDAAAENLETMVALGWGGDFGLFEAADARHPDADGGPSLVRSHMAHHQGMLLCAICNALTRDSLARDFMADPRARALSLLLEERPACAARLRPRKSTARAGGPAPRPVRRAVRGGGAADIHLLVGGGARAFVSADGALHYARGPIDGTRFGRDLADRPDAARLYCRVNGVNASFDGRAAFDAGSAAFEADLGPLRARMVVSLSPEDGALYRSVTLGNPTAAPVRAELLDVAPVALARPGDMLAHPAFQLLFVEAAPFGDAGLIFTRRPRNPGETCPALIHAAEAPCAVLRESRCEAALDRDGEPRFDFAGEIRPAPLNPAGALLARLEIAPGETARLCFALKLTDGAPALGFAPERAVQLGRARTEALLGFLGIPAAEYHRLDRLAALLLDPRLAAHARAARGPAGNVPKEALWALGVSGDRPIIALSASDAGCAACVRTALHAHAFYRAMGVSTDLLLIDGGAAGYDRPVRRMLDAALDACAVRENVRILEGLTGKQLAQAERCAAIRLVAGDDFDRQIQALLDSLSPGEPRRPLDPGPGALPEAPRVMDNGFGGFAPDGAYVIDVGPGPRTPAPWCHLLANDEFGMLLTERGGGFLWHGNSRSGRLTPWRGDPMWERYGLALELRGPNGEALSLLPGMRPAMPFRACFSPDGARYAFSSARASGDVMIRLSERAAVIDVALDLPALRGAGWAIAFNANWLMGTGANDACRLRTWRTGGAEYAAGTMDGVGWLAPASIAVHPGANALRFAVGWAADAERAQADARDLREGRLAPVPHAPPRLHFETPDFALDAMLNAFLPHQVRASRVLGRTGYYQPGGAYGFRDQLQDMLALIPLDPARVRRHLLMCAARQFAAGDALHWWHMPYLGVRTRIADDRLFLPFTAAAYVRQTGDSAALNEVVPFLEDVSIPEGREDVFQEMRPGGEAATLHGHCMRAFDAVAVGAHGLALMGAGDWNDGMNRVSREGRGESVWLSMFVAVCADAYADICPEPEDARKLRALAARHRAAVEEHGWDGRWYRRAYADDGSVLGGAASPACRIDLLPQAWAVLAGLDPARARAAVDAAWERLADGERGLVRLLDPPFDGEGPDPGYIRGYPPGVRENGAQYTHAACWLLLALIRLGDAERAHRLVQMLLPPNHADTPEKAVRYRVEPYVMAGDICAMPEMIGRGGWTWYTGSAAWLYVCCLELLGYERRGDRVRLRALLGDWPEAALAIRHGRSTYRLVCAADAASVTLDGAAVDGGFVELHDDGRPHEARFPPR